MTDKRLLPPVSPEYFSLSELAAHFGVSVSTAKKLAIPFTRIRNQRRYPRRLVEKYALEHSTQPKAWLCA